MKTTKFKEVKNLAQANEVGVVYSTKNFKIFKIMKNNRGYENGIEPKRLADFRKLYADGKYYEDVIHLFINLAGVVIDGHHKLALHMELNLPINFTILPQKEFNSGTETQILAAIARFNAKSSKWDGAAHFQTALLCKEPLALAIAGLKAEAEAKYGFKKNLLSPNRIFALITEDEKGLSSVSKNVEDYCRRELVKVLTSDSFKKEFNFVCAILNRVNQWNVNHKYTDFITPFFFIRSIMPKVWGNELNMEKFFHKFVNTELYKVSNTTYGTAQFVDMLNEMSVKKTEVLISFE